MSFRKSYQLALLLCIFCTAGCSPAEKHNSQNEQKPDANAASDDIKQQTVDEPPGNPEAPSPVNPTDSANAAEETVMDSADDSEKAESENTDESSEQRKIRPGECRKESCPCGDQTCKFAEICDDNRCKTAFNYNILMEPVKVQDAVVTDKGDYWECDAEQCEYTYLEANAYPESRFKENSYHPVRPSSRSKKITLIKGTRVRGKLAYCGGESLPLSELADYKCSNVGWICYSPKGCKYNYEYNDLEAAYEGCSIGIETLTLSPGQFDGKPRDSADDNVKLCKDGHCECGSHICGKGQYCAFGNCYYGGEIRNGYGEFEFKTTEAGEADNFAGVQVHKFSSCGKCTHEEGSQCSPMDELVCLAGTNPKASGYKEFRTYSQSWAYDFWQCVEDICQCGDATCPKNAFCANEQCFLSHEIYGSNYTTDESVDDILKRKRPSVPNYISKTNKEDDDALLWQCAEGKTCQCNGEALPAGADCFVDIAGKEQIHYGGKRFKPSNPEHYQFVEGKWICSNDQCVCNGMPLPKGAYCDEKDGKEAILCGDNSMDTPAGYICEQDKWVCEANDGKTCRCGKQVLPENAYCQSRPKGLAITCGPKPLGSMQGYRCDKTTNTWVCDLKDGCNCNGRALLPNTHCEVFEFSNTETEMMVCGDAKMPISQGYTCVDNKIVCTQKEGCKCDGKPLIENAECHGYWDKIENMYCHNTPFAQSEGENPVQLECKEYGCDEANGWLCKVDLDKPKPEIKANSLTIHKDFNLKPGQTCEHVKGCFCSKSLCPVTGQCTESGCIDPATAKPFEKVDGYLTSGFLRQCDQKDGCKCGDKTIEYRKYCLNNELRHVLFSGLLDGKRVVCEDNYDSHQSPVEARKNIGSSCFDASLNPAQYYMRDCIRLTSRDEQCYRDFIYGDDEFLDYHHEFISQCSSKEGCSCGSSTCAIGESCYLNRCMKIDSCFDLGDYESKKIDEGIAEQGTWWETHNPAEDVYDDGYDGVEDDEF